MKTALSFIIGLLLISCNISQYKGNNIVRYQPPTLKQKIQGEWTAQKVVYDFGLVDENPNRSFEFDLYSFFKTRYTYKDEYHVKTNLYEVKDNTIRLLNKETFEVFEIAEVIEVTNTTLTISTLYPADNKYTVHMTR